MVFVWKIWWSAIYHKHKGVIVGKRGGLKKEERKSKKIKPFKKVLIVCEGEKTEPHYFQNLIKFLGLNSARIQIEINGKCGSSPKSVVQYAKEKAEKDLKVNPYDKVYCVFDRDRHVTFAEAKQQIKDNAEKLNMEAIISYPCFEFWMLLHFKDTTTDFGKSGGSPCDDLIKNSLSKYIKNYSKGGFKNFQLLFEKMDIAKKNAKQANQSAKKEAREYATTDVVEIVEFLEKLKKEQDEFFSQ